MVRFVRTKKYFTLPAEHFACTWDICFVPGTDVLSLKVQIYRALVRWERENTSA